VRLVLQANQAGEINTIVKEWGRSIVAIIHRSCRIAALVSVLALRQQDKLVLRGSRDGE